MHYLPEVWAPSNQRKAQEMAVFRHLGAACFALAAFTFGCDESAQELTVMTIATGEHDACLPADDANPPLRHWRVRLSTRHVARGEREHLRRAQPWRASLSTKRAAWPKQTSGHQPEGARWLRLLSLETSTRRSIARDRRVGRAGGARAGAVGATATPALPACWRSAVWPAAPPRRRPTTSRPRSPSTMPSMPARRTGAAPRRRSPA